MALALWLGGCGWFGNPLEKAAAHLERGDFAAARIEASNAIQKRGSDAEAYYLYGRALLGLGEYATADSTLKYAAQLGMPAARLDAFRAQTLLKLRAYDRILAELRPGPDHEGETLALVLAARGQAELAKARADEARSSFQAALKAAPALPEALLGQARLALSENNPGEALTMVDQVLSRSPKHARAWEMKALVAQSQGATAEAIKALAEAATHDVRSIEAPLGAAELSIGLRQFSEAQRYIEKARKRSPNAIQVRLVQALLHFEQQQYAEALGQVQAIHKKQVGTASSLTLAGAAHLAQGDLKEAEHHFGVVLRAQPDHPLARRLYATTLLRKGQPEQALEALKPALESARADPRLYALAAEVHARLKDYTGATAYYEKIAALDPEQTQAQTRVGMAKIADGRVAEGLAVLEKATALSKDDVSAGVALATVLLNRGEYRKALAAANSMQSQAPRNPIGFHLAGRALLKLNDAQAARKMFERAVEIDLEYWPAAAQLAQLDLAAGKRDAARERLQRVLAKDVNNLQKITALLQITGNRGQYVEALETARKADPKATAPRVALAREYLARGLPEPALAVAQEALTVAPGDVEAIEIIGSVRLAAGLHKEALATFRDLVARAPASSVAQAKLAAALAATEDFRAAEAAYEKALALPPVDSDAFIGLAQLYQRTGRAQEALDLARELQKKEPKRATGHILAGDLHLRAARYRDAIKAYDQGYALEPSGRILIARHIAQTQAGDKTHDAALVQWLHEHPNDLAVRMYLADLHYIAGRYREAAEHYEAIVKLDPNRPIAWNNLASAYLQLKDVRALSAAEAAHRLNPNDVSILDTLGVAQTRHGKAKAAVDTLKKAVAHRPDSADIRINYALALAKSGDAAGGRNELARVVSSHTNVLLGEEAKALLQSR